MSDHATRHLLHAHLTSHTLQHEVARDLDNHVDWSQSQRRRVARRTNGCTARSVPYSSDRRTKTASAVLRGQPCLAAARDARELQALQSERRGEGRRSGIGVSDGRAVEEGHEPEQRAGGDDAAATSACAPRVSDAHVELALDPSRHDLALLVRHARERDGTGVTLGRHGDGELSAGRRSRGARQRCRRGWIGDARRRAAMSGSHETRSDVGHGRSCVASRLCCRFERATDVQARCGAEAEQNRTGWAPAAEPDPVPGADLDLRASVAPERIGIRRVKLMRSEERRRAKHTRAGPRGVH